MTRSYVDGLGRARASVTLAEGTSQWEQSGVATFTPRGTAARSYQAAILSTSDPSPAQAVTLGTIYSQALYDAFGRQTVSIAEDGATSAVTYHALSSEAWDPLDLEVSGDFENTPAITRTDGHGRVIDQVLINRQPGSSTDELYRLWSDYRADGAVTAITRAETTSAVHRASATVVASRSTSRAFTYDTAGRRIASTDPDTDSDDGSKTAANRTWRYLFNVAGDLVAVRDPRGCGQNFYYDRAGRLVAEGYVECDEAQVSGDEPDEDVPMGSVALDIVESTVDADVRHYFDGEDPGWSGFPTPPTSYDFGRLNATSDRGQRTLFAFDKRGNPVWQARQMAFLDDAASIPSSITNPATGPIPVETSDAPTRATRVFDEANAYELSTSYDHGGRPDWTDYPTDPGWDTMGGANPGPPLVQAQASYNARGLAHRARARIGGDDYWIRNATDYNASRLPTRFELGDDQGASRDPTEQFFTYDDRLRTTRTWVTREGTGGMSPDLSAVTRPLDQSYTWDDANNLTGVDDGRLEGEWGAGYRPQRAAVTHDALYRVAGVDYEYHQSGGSWTTSDTGTDWRTARAFHQSADPMQEVPAPMAPTAATNRTVSLVYSHDWLANMVEWTDDASAFYERSIGDITNGFDESLRPSALYLSSNLPTSAPSYEAMADRGGWVELDYGESGNVVAMTVHAQCRDVDMTTVCWDDHGNAVDTRRDDLRDDCVCASEQHYQYRWDELDRLSEARRYDRPGTGSWDLAVRQRYRYDGANVRTVKETFDQPSTADRSALYVYPGSFERTGVERNIINTRYDKHSSFNTEVQYLVAGSRIVWKTDTTPPPYDLGSDVRITVALADLLGSTSAVVDFWSGELLEVGTWYPNGAQETLLSQQSVGIQPEPMGFTGKEADDEVGVVYFGERYLIPRIGRWACPDPLHVHAVGGGEALNSYHYVRGSILQAQDPVGLDVKVEANQATSSSGATHTTSQGEAEAAFLRDVRASVEASERSSFAMDQGELAFTGDRSGVISDVAKHWITMIESSSEVVMLPVTAMSGRDAVVRSLFVGDTLEISAASMQTQTLRLRPGFDPGVPGGNVGHTTDVRGAGRARQHVAYLTASGANQPQVRRSFVARGNRTGDRRLTHAPDLQGQASATVVHETAAHVIANWRGQASHDNFNPFQLTTAGRPNMDAIRRAMQAGNFTPTNPSHLLRSLPLERQAWENAGAGGEYPGGPPRQRQIDLLQDLQRALRTTP